MRKKNKEIYVAGLQVIECLIDKLSVKFNYERTFILSECIQYLERLADAIEKSRIQSDMILLNEIQKSITDIQLLLNGNLDIREVYHSINNLKNKILDSSVQHEVVFLPYKASMWDSFDSIYKEAVADESTNVKVIPIPYYSMEKKSETKKFHYEGDLFPEYVQISNYQTYDLELEKPDVIFIHNPYDNMNLVTQVLEEYFSSNLVRCTEHLVYIPYDVIQQNKVEINYCLTPGVKNAWRVFLQSDNIREQYIKWHEDKEKFVALGSPKVDAIINAADVWNTVPKEWKEKCQAKKIIFYNTHLSGIMADSKLQLNKIQKMYEYFKNHSEVVLLWRPHPLSIQTAEALNPNFLQDYLHIIEKMKTLQNVIYDDTSDLNRSIAISDGYVGDQSSLVLLYALTGKPILLSSGQNRGLEDRDRNLLLSCNGVIVGDFLWTTYDFRNALFKINIKTGDVEFVAAIPKVGMLVEMAFKRLIYWNNNIFFIPMRANYFVKYNIIENAFLYKECNLNERLKYGTIIQQENMLFVFPSYYTNMYIKINLDTFDVQEHEFIDSLLSKEVKNLNVIFTASYGDCHNGNLWIPLYQSNGILEVSPKSYRIHRINKDSHGIRQIQYDGKCIWGISSNRPELFSWSKENNILKVVDFGRLIEDRNLDRFEVFIIYQDNIWLLPARAQYLIKYNKKLETIQKISLPEGMNSGFENYSTQFSDCQRVDEILYIPQYRSQYMLQVNLLTDSIEAKSIQLPEGCDENWRMEQRFDNNNIIDNKKVPEEFLYKDTTCTIDRFVQILDNWDDKKNAIQREVFSDMNDTLSGDAGKRIWLYIKKELERII